MLLELMMLVLLLMHLVVPVLVISSFAANKISIKQLYAFDENLCESASLVFARGSGSLVYLFNG